MNKFIKILLTAFATLSLSMACKAQNHVVGTSQQQNYKGAVSSYYFSYRNQNANGLIPWREAVDTVRLSSTEVLNGGNYTLVVGDVPGALTSLFVAIDTASTSDPYTLNGTDTAFIVSKYNETNVSIGYLADTVFSTDIGGTSFVPISTNFSDIDSINIYLSIPAGKLTNGTHNYLLIYKYIITPGIDFSWTE